MDERTRRTDEELTPNMRRTAPPPDVVAKSRTRLWIGVGLIAILLAVAVYETVHWLKSAPSGGRFPQGALQSVGGATVGTGNIREIVNALGTVTPIATVTVQTQINGQLTDVAFTEGQLVKKGDFLAQIDARPYQILKEQYEGQLAHDEGLLAQAQMDLTRYQTLAQQNSIAKQQAEDQIFIVQQYRGSVQQDQGLVDSEALNIAYCHIVSPITGRVGLRLVDPGNYVQTTTSTGIAVLTQLQPITVIFSVAEDYLPQIQKQMKAGHKMSVDALDRDQLTKLASGSLLTLDNQIDTSTGTVKLKAIFQNGDLTLFPNQFVNIKLLVTTLQGATLIPSSTIQHNGQTAFVYVLQDDTAHMRTVQTGVTDEGTTQVTGVSPGDLLANSSFDKLQDNSKIVVSKQPLPASTSPGSNAP